MNNRRKQKRNEKFRERRKLKRNKNKIIIKSIVILQKKVTLIKSLSDTVQNKKIAIIKPIIKNNNKLNDTIIDLTDDNNEIEIIELD